MLRVRGVRRAHAWMRAEGATDTAVNAKKNNSQKAGLRRRDPQFSPRAVAMISLSSLAAPGCYLAVLGLANTWNAAGPSAVTRLRLRPVLLVLAGRHHCRWLG